MSNRGKRSQSAHRKPARRMGRPTAEQSQALDEKIRSVALDLFLEGGFDTVTMEDIAEGSNITKRTLYMRYKDKAELFSAALYKARDEWSFSYDDSGVQADAPLEVKLLALAEALLARSLQPRIIKLARTMTAQANSFPEEVRSGYDMSLSPRITTVIGVLMDHREEIKAPYIKDNGMTAELFLGMITGIPIRLAGMGVVRDAKFEKNRVRLAVRLFLEAILKK